MPKKSSSSNHSKESNSNEFEDFIIKTNMLLQNENRTLRKSNDILINENFVREAEYSKTDDIIKYMKELLKNLTLIKDKSIKLNEILENYTLKMNETFKQHDNFKNMNIILNINIYLLCILFLFDYIINYNITFFYYLNYQTIVILIIYIFFKIFEKENQFQIQFLKNYKIIGLFLKDDLLKIYNEKKSVIITINNIKTEIEKIESRCISVYNLIDNI